MTIGLHVSAEVSTIDVAMPDGATHLSDGDVRRVEDDVNSRIQRDVPVRCWFPSEEELKTLPLRKPPTVSEHVRSWPSARTRWWLAAAPIPPRRGSLAW